MFAEIKFLNEAVDLAYIRLEDINTRVKEKLRR